jgi:hypothetical protein
VFSVGSAPRLYHSTDRVESASGVESRSSAVGSQFGELWSCSEIGDSQRGSEAVNTEATALEAVTRRLVKIAD